MSSPVVGIIGNHYLINDDYPVHASGDMNAWAVREVSDALPIIILPDQNLAPIDDIMETCDGFVFTCLLYTSPSPRDVEETRMPSSA